MEILGLGEGVAYQGDPTHIHRCMTSSLALVLDMLILLRPPCECDRPSIPRGWAVTGVTPYSQRVVWLQDLVYKMTKGSWGETGRAGGGQMLVLGILELDAGTGERTATIAPPTHEPLCLLFLCLARQPFFTKAWYHLCVTQFSNERLSPPKLLP